MKARRIARKPAGLVLIFTAALVCAASGCSALSYLGELNYLGQWVSSYLGTSTTTSS